MTTNKIMLECPACGYKTPYLQPLPACPNCKSEWLEASYPYKQVREVMLKKLGQRPFKMWRYRELMPLRVDSNIVTMDEGGTPLIYASNLAQMMGRPHIYIKDERQGPTGSFKDRQASLAVSVMKETGVSEVVVASTGNVAISYSAYCARVGIRVWAFLNSMVPPAKMREVALYGAEVIKVTGTYDQAKQMAAAFAERKGLHLDRGIRSFAQRESMKALAFEIAEQLGAIFGPEMPGMQPPFRAPDWYIQSISGGLGPVGVWKGFEELKQMGLIDKMPRIANIQVEGCAPIVNSFRAGLEEAEPVLVPQTRVITLATGNPGAAYPALRRITLASNGAMEAVSDEEAFRAMHVMAKMDGVSMESAAGVAFAGLFKLISQQMIQPDDIVIVNCSGHTVPVEVELLGEAWAHSVAAPESVTPMPIVEQEGLIAALERLDERVKSIAIVDDNPNAVRLLKRILQARGKYIIHEAYGGREGLSIIRSERPDLVLLDLMMPELDGFGVMEAMKAEKALQNIPVIVISALSPQELTPVKRKQLADQVKVMLQKGAYTDLDLLEDIIKEVLE
ncbi:MAG: pyridoxal-phosphate dependent enzyme [Thermoflexales bacterium]|nr:pyridoxal-phosphate dependent enzyme [Thermoflexales bacterium]